MNQTRLIIRDATRAIYGDLPANLADAVVASVAAEPETIAELETALERFTPRTTASPLAAFKKGAGETLSDRPTVIIDLSARVIAGEVSYAIDKNLGELLYPEQVHSEDVWLIYRLPPDWLLVESAAEYSDCRASRIEERLHSQPVRRLDARQVLYGLEMTSFLARECEAAHRSGEEYPIPDIHARWLMTPRADLAGQTPREVLHARCDFIDFDLHTRQIQWSFLLEGPPGLSRESFAYRFAGFGTHEIVLYYELIRVLLGACWKRLSRGSGLGLGEADPEGETEGEYLKGVANGWLEQPQYDEGGMIPAAIIESERRRIPLVLSPAQAMIDEDCEWCRMMADEETFGPTFRHLDGCNMDNEFVFSLFGTLAEWEEEQRLFAELDAKFEGERAERQALSVDDLNGLYEEGDDDIPF